MLSSLVRRTTTRFASALSVSTIGATMEIKLPTTPCVSVGDALPTATLYEGGGSYVDDPTPVDLAALCKGRKVVIFAVPGAFTPGCSKAHLPSFVAAAADLAAAGVDEVVCTATNDAHVMKAWGVDLGAEAVGIRMLADKDAELACALGQAKVSGAIVRSLRYAMVVEDGTVSAFLPVGADGDKSATHAPAVLQVVLGAAGAGAAAEGAAGVKRKAEDA